MAALQKMINVAASFCRQFCLTFNVKKSKIMIFGKSHKDPSFRPITINDEAVDIVTEWRYLGVTLTAGNRLGFSARPDLNSFFRVVNSIIGALKDAHEHVLLSLIYTNCVPILTYASDVKEYSNSELSDYNVAMNSALRRVFGFKQWQSIRVLREAFGFKSLFTLFKKAQDKFLHSCKSHSNATINFLSNCNLD